MSTNCHALLPPISSVKYCTWLQNELSWSSLSPETRQYAATRKAQISAKTVGLIT
jgi:hypothetical protein